MYQIKGTLDAGIVPVVDLLRRKGFNTFASCQGGPGHAFAHPTVRIEPAVMLDMLSDVRLLSLVLSEAGYSGYSIKQVNAFQDEAFPWTGQPGLNYIEVEFWQYPLEHPAGVYQVELPARSITPAPATEFIGQISFSAPEGWTPGQLLVVEHFAPITLTTKPDGDVDLAKSWSRDQLAEMGRTLDRQIMGDTDAAKEG